MAHNKSTCFPFTDRKLAHLRPDSAVYEVGDAASPGLRLRVSPSGRKVFRWYFREATGKHRVLTLGAYGTGPDQIALARARQDLAKAKESHAEALAHGDPEITSSRVTTVTELAELFYERRIAKQRKRPWEARAILDRDIIPTLGKRKLRTLQTPQVGAMILKVVDRGAPVHAGKVLGLTKQLFRSGVSLGYLTVNPAEPLRAADLGVESNVRDRHLSADEIALFWDALARAPRMSESTRLAFKILLLSGVRSQELLLARWRDVDPEAAEWTIPVENQKLTLKQAKKARAFRIPLPRLLVDLFDDLKAITGHSEWIMASEDSESGHYTDKALGRAMRRMFEQKPPLLTFEPASPHDLRRTMRTVMAEHLDIEPHVAEKCLNHSLGRLEDIYDKSTLLRQRREAMERWADFVVRTAGEGDNVLELRSS